MADIQKNPDNTPEPQGSDKAKKPGGILRSVFMVLLALLIIMAVSTGVFYFTVKNNVNGLADRLRPRIKNIPVLNLALPGEPEEDDPEKLTHEQLVIKYNEYRQKNKELKKSLDEANSTIDELNKKLASIMDEEAILEENRQTLDKITSEKKNIDDEKKQLSEMIARGDTEGFREYFEKVDKETAEEIYKEIVEKEALEEEKKALGKSFASMEPERAAQVLAELYKKDKEVLLDIFEGLKTSAGASILSEMDPQTAAEITKMLADRKIGRYSSNQ